MLFEIYIFASGQEVGPWSVLLEVPLVAETGFSTKNWWKSVSDKSHVFKKYVSVSMFSSRHLVFYFLWTFLIGLVVLYIASGLELRPLAFIFSVYVLIRKKKIIEILSFLCNIL